MAVRPTTYIDFIAGLVALLLVLVVGVLAVLGKPSSDVLNTALGGVVGYILRAGVAQGPAIINGVKQINGGAPNE